MTGSDFNKLISWLEDRWPGTRAYRKAEDLFVDFMYADQRDAFDAAHHFYHEGRKTAPTASELIAQTRKLAKARGREKPQIECENHVWAILAEDPETHEREAMCSVCKEERTFPAGTLNTLAETDPDKLTSQQRVDWI